jgi:hypothetical protein
MPFEMPARGPSADRSRMARFALVAAAAAVLSACGTSVEEALIDPPPTPPESTGRTFDDPFVITAGGTYSGNWQSFDSRTPAVLIRTSEPVIIEDSAIRGAGTLIHTEAGLNVDLTVRNVYGEALTPNVAGRYPGRFLVADTYRRIVVEQSQLEGTSGIWLHRSTPGATVQIRYNRARNIDGRRQDGQGGFTGEIYYVQFVQFDKGNALVDSEVAWNEVINEPFESRVEDVINFFQTSGTSASPLRIHNNYIQGAYPVDPVNGYFSGGGIMLGDAGGAYLHALRNVVIDTANYGIAIAGGQHNRIVGNTVVSCGLLSDGRAIGSQNVGIYIWNNSRAHAYGDNSGRDNAAAWMKHTGSRNDWWVPDAASWTDNVQLEADRIGLCDLADEARATWLDRVAEAGLRIGPDFGAP